MLLTERAISNIEDLALSLVVNSQYVNEMMNYHTTQWLVDNNLLNLVVINRIRQSINPRDPECESGFAIARLMDKNGNILDQYQPIISFNQEAFDDLGIYEMDDINELMRSFISTVLHEIRHLAQFYEVCRQVGSITGGVKLYNDINKYVISKYPWPFTPLENDALNTMYTIDPFKDYYDYSITPLISKLIQEVSDEEE